MTGCPNCGTVHAYGKCAVGAQSDEGFQITRAELDRDPSDWDSPTEVRLAALAAQLWDRALEAEDGQAATVRMLHAEQEAHRHTRERLREATASTESHGAAQGAEA